MDDSMGAREQEELATTHAVAAVAPPTRSSYLPTALADVGALAVQLQRCTSPPGVRGLPQELAQLVALLGHRDLLVAYAAKEALLGVLGSTSAILSPQRDAGAVVCCVLSGSLARTHAASGFRFQLLRQLIKQESGGVAHDTESVAGSAHDSESGEEASHLDHPPPYLSALAANLHLLRTSVHNTFIVTEEDAATGAHPAEPTICYEALALLSAFVKLLYDADHDSVRLGASQLSGLSELMTELLDKVLLQLEYGSQPAFVTCAVLELLGDFLALGRHAKEGGVGVQDGVASRCYDEWLQRCLAWVKASSCTAEALQLLHTPEPSDVACQASFISERSRFPFLQQWLVLLSLLGVALAGEDARTEVAAGRELRSSEHAGETGDAWLLEQLPRRSQLFEVLSEQDDVMVEVLCALTRMAPLLSAVSTAASSDGGSQRHVLLAGQLACPVGLATHAAQEFDPDLLFTDLMAVFGWDHLVLLDLLVSSETRMLEYLLLYLRRLGARWSDSKRVLLRIGKLDDLLSVLIRLRLEINRLVDADLFPYGAKPLVRRLLAVEQLYEGEEDTKSATVDTRPKHSR